MHCPQCQFEDYEELDKRAVKKELRDGSLEDVVLVLVVCKVCGNVYAVNYRELWED